MLRVLLSTNKTCLRLQKTVSKSRTTLYFNFCNTFSQPARTYFVTMQVLTLVVKRDIFCSNVAKQVPRFCFLFTIS